MGRRDPHFFTQAGPVTVTQTDGSTKEQPAYGEHEYQELVKVRWRPPESTRAKVFRRDHSRCRYCGSRDDLTIDHVVPIALGGSNRLRNLVACCSACNTRKGATVWQPRP